MPTPLGRRVAAGLGVLSLTAFVGAASVVLVQPTAHAASSGAGWTSAAKTVTRSYFPGNSASAVTVSNTVKVSINKHTNLQARERVQVSWTGATQTGDLAGNPYGESGSDQEYPVVVMQCRGTTTTVTPQTCWTNTSGERSYQTSTLAAAWRGDTYNTAADSAQISGIANADLANCNVSDTSVSYHFTPFITKAGKLFPGCDQNHMPPEAAVGSVDPANEVFGQTQADGTGSVNFEVRTAAENQSVDCSQKVACSLVVIPIQGLSCAKGGDACDAGPNYFPGGAHNPSIGASLAVSGYLWWSPSNWRNRFVLPLDFAPPPNVCQLSSAGTPVPFYGSELISQTALQWAPAYCLNKSRFNWQSNSMPDDAALALAGNNGAAAAEVTGAGTTSTTGFAFAPTALTGYGIAFNIDNPATGAPLKQLKLDARLLAKLLSESYAGDSIGAKHPGMTSNPWTIASDPEFLKLNPGFQRVTGESDPYSAATLLALSNGSLVMSQLSGYINSDPDARAFLNGKADPWGMKVNQYYKGIKLPVSTWPLLDQWIPSHTGNQCLDSNPAVYTQKIAAPVSSLRLIATAMLFNWPMTQMQCDIDVNSGIWKISRSSVEPYGQRMMLGLVTLGDAARYGLPVASLQSAPGRFVAPNNASILAAVAAATLPGPLLPLQLDPAHLSSVPAAYPGAMIVYTAARTSGLSKAQAADVHQFIQISSSEGQAPGRGNGQLADGYVPIVKSGATARLWTQAQAAGAAILAQQGSPAAPASSTPVAGIGAGAPAAPSQAPGVSSPGKGTPTAVVTAGPLQTTAAVSSGMSGGLLPTLLTVGLIAGLAMIATRFWLWVKGSR